MAVTGLFLLKVPIERAIPRLQKLNYKQLEAEFNRELNQIEQDAKIAGLQTIEDAEVVQDFEHHLKQIAKISPNAAIVEAFRELERAAKALLKLKGYEPDYKVAAPYRLSDPSQQARNIALSALASRCARLAWPASWRL